jgi:hypothetical protein
VGKLNIILWPSACDDQLLCDHVWRGGSAAVGRVVVVSDWRTLVATKVSKLFVSLSHGQSECNVLSCEWLGEGTA